MSVSGSLTAAKREGRQALKIFKWEMYGRILFTLCPLYSLIIFISRARPTLKLPCISPQNSVTCNGEYRRPVIKAQPSFNDVEVDGGYVEYHDK